MWPASIQLAQVNGSAVVNHPFMSGEKFGRGPFFSPQSAFILPGLLHIVENFKMGRILQCRAGVEYMGARTKAPRSDGGGWGGSIRQNERFPGRCCQTSVTAKMGG